MIVLGIESSCDETAASLCVNGKIQSNIIFSQNIHNKFGGVVPELASRSHLKNIVPTVREALNKSKITIKNVNAIAYTRGPGLLGALMVGASFAKSLAFALNIPLLPVHHIKAHILSHFIESPVPSFPFLCIVASGGHTLFVKVSSYTQMEIRCQTQDDAVGEAFDKCAKMLNLDYPGGPLIDKLSQKGNPNAFTFSSNHLKKNAYSYSGIKTSFLYFLREMVKGDSHFIEKNIHDLCASIQNQLVEMLLYPLHDLTKKEKINSIALAGGVAANSHLRTKLNEMANQNNWKVFFPKFEYCTDNAAMVAFMGKLYLEKGLLGNLSDEPLPRWHFEE